MAINVVNGIAAELPSPQRIKLRMKKREKTTLKKQSIQN